MKVNFALLSIVIIFLMMAILGCKEEPPIVIPPTPIAKIPSLTTTAISEILAVSAVTGGNITNDGGASVTERGVCWGTSQTPVITNFKTSDGTGLGVFTSSIIGLTPNTTYYVRAYATNSVGIGYGNTITFTSGVMPIIFNPNLSYGTVVDIDGNVYKTIVIGTQTWMAENLKTTKYRNGDLIGTTTPATLDIRSESSPKYQWAYDGKENTVVVYGRLYTLYAATDSRSICPLGWHLQTVNDINNLLAYLDVLNVGTLFADKLKEVGTSHWSGTNAGAINSSGFTALPAGMRDYNGVFGYIGNEDYWWIYPEVGYINNWGISSNEGGFSTILNYQTKALSVRCVLGDTEPKLTTTTVSAISQTTATSGGNVSDDGGSPVIERGVCWRINQNPIISDNKTSNGTGTGSFISELTGLVPNSTYYVRAYATNSIGTGYGDIITFTTGVVPTTIIFNPNLTYGTVKDIEGNVYKTIVIGTQTWMAENLKTTKYQDNTSIPNVTNNALWESLTSPAYCWYLNNATNKITYGALYNWYTINTGKLCPNGWHVPTDTEWTTLIDYLGGWTVAGGKLKETGTSHWQTSNAGAINSSGFTALPGGYRYYGGSFIFVGIRGYWWSSSENSTLNAWLRCMSYTVSSVESYYDYKTYGFSVRCVKD